MLLTKGSSHRLNLQLIKRRKENRFHKGTKINCSSLFCARAVTTPNMAYVTPSTITLSSQVRLHELCNILHSRPHIGFVIIEIHVRCFRYDYLFSRTANKLIQPLRVP